MWEERTARTAGPSDRAIADSAWTTSRRHAKKLCGGSAISLSPARWISWVIAFGLCIEGLSAHQNTKRIVERDRAGGRVERPRAVARVSGGLGALDSRCAEDWETLHARPYQTHRAALFRSPFCTPRGNGVQARLPCCPQQNPTIHDRSG